MSVPGVYTGNTCYALDDYNHACPYAWTAGRDIVYRYTALANQNVTFSLCRSGYDTKLMVYDGSCAGTPAWCNDDALLCPGALGPFRSLLECLPLQASHTYYIVVDCYHVGYCGDYLLEAGICPPCTLTCAGTDSIECTEIPDTSHAGLDCDGGCNLLSMGMPPLFETIACGQTVAGKCMTFVREGSWYRDTDWFRFTVTTAESLRVTAVAEFDLTVLVVRLLGDTCNPVILYWTMADPCSTLELTTACLDTGAYVLWIGPSVFVGIPDPADYRATLTCLPCAVPGTDCATAIPISDDTTLLGQTTCGLGHDYENSCLGPFSEGEDIIYRWTVTQEGDYTLWLNPHDSGWSGILLDDQCPPDTTDCIAQHTSGAAFSHGVACQHLTPGTYYVGHVAGSGLHF